MAEQAGYQLHYEAQNSRILVDYVTDHGQYHAAHWQNELEMIYLLNGSAQLVLDGHEIRLVQGEFIVIDSNRVFELHSREHFMQVRVHVDREFLLERMGEEKDPAVTGRIFRCSREELTGENLPSYLEMCDLFKDLVPLYITQPSGYRLKTESIVLDILFRLVQNFSIPLYSDDEVQLPSDRVRIQQILAYIEEHYREPLTLSDAAGEFGLSREYFSRLFHKSVGITFLKHVNRVRIAHFYHALVNTDEPIMTLLEECGITNYKQFSRAFREIYGMTPREVRRR